MLLKIPTHLMSGFVTFCFDGLFVKCFRHGSSVIILYKKHVSNLQSGYSKIRRNCKNKMLCPYKDIIIFVGGAFSMDVSVYSNTSSQVKGNRRKTRPYITERLLMGHRESNQTNKQTKVIGSLK